MSLRVSELSVTTRKSHGPLPDQSADVAPLFQDEEVCALYFHKGAIPCAGLRSGVGVPWSGMGGTGAKTH